MGIKRWIALAGAFGLGLMLTGCKSNCGCCGGGCKIGRGEKMASSKPGGTPHAMPAATSQASPYATAQGTPQSWDHLPKQSMAATPRTGPGQPSPMAGMPVQRTTVPPALPTSTPGDLNDPIAAEPLDTPVGQSATTSLRPPQEPAPALPMPKSESPSDAPVHEVSSPPEPGGVMLPPPPERVEMKQKEAPAPTPAPAPSVDPVPIEPPEVKAPVVPPGPVMTPPPALEKPPMEPKADVAPPPPPPPAVEPMPAPPPPPAPVGGSQPEPELELPPPAPGAPPLLPPGN